MSIKDLILTGPTTLICRCINLKTFVSLHSAPPQITEYRGGADGLAAFKINAGEEIKIMNMNDNAINTFVTVNARTVTKV